MRAAGGLLGCEVAFPVLHGPFGEDGTVQGLLESLEVAYAGPSVLAAAVAMDKLICKRLLAFWDLPQVEFCEVGEAGWREHAAAMPKPLWVKPSRLGSSVGISRVANPEAELDAAIERRARHDPRVIIEADAGGREVECSVIGNTGIGDARASRPRCPGEIVTRASDWYDFEAKYCRGRAWSWSCRRRSATTPSRGCASSPRACSRRSPAPASPAATSSSATTARSW